MALTGKDVQEATFTTSRKGYSKDEVDDFLDRVVESIEEYRGRVADLESRLGMAPAQSEQPGPGSDMSGFAAPAVGAGDAATGPGLAAVTPGQASTTGLAAQTPVSPTPQTPVSSTPSAQQAPAAAPVQAPEEPATAQESGHQAGWYPDPWQQASERYYDGKEWTAQTR